MGGYHMPFGGLTGLLIIIVIGIVLYRVFTSGSSGRNSADEILDERYAKGELSEQEYRKMKEEIRK